MTIKNQKYANRKEKPPVDSIVLIRFGKSGILFNWNNSTGRIVEDALFHALVLRFKTDKTYLIDQITNLSVTAAIACGREDKLLIGDLAFLIIDKINNLPFFEITNAQCDVFKKGCPYPIGYFDVIKKDRLRIKERVKQYL